MNGLLEENPSMTPETAPQITGEDASGDVKIMFRITDVGRGVSQGSRHC
jgi:hypothetical protein